MALIKDQPAAPGVQPNPVHATPVDEAFPPRTDEDVPPFEIDQGAHPVQADTALAEPARVASAPAVASQAPLQALSEAGYQGLAFDWTSFPTISLKNEGQFEDIEKTAYGNSFTCKVLSTKERFVYRAEPVQDNKKDVLFTYDKVTGQRGENVQEWLDTKGRQGKNCVERTYIEALVEMVAEGQPWDGEYRILSISPTSKGRFSAYLTIAGMKSGGQPASVVTKVYVGRKVTSTANAFYPWAFEIYAG